MEKFKKYTTNWRSLVLPICIFIFTILLFSHLNFTTFAVGNSTDSSWQYTLSGLRHSDQTLGADILFTYGPLFEVMPTYVHAKDTVQNFVIGNVLFFFILGMAMWVFWRIFGLAKKRLQKNVNLVMPVLVLGILLTLTDIDTAFNIFLLATVIAARAEKDIRLKFVLLSGVMLLALYKFSYLIPVIALLPFIFVKNLHWKEIAKGLGFSALGVLICFGFYSLLTLSFSPAAFATFAYLGTVNTAAYGEFMGLTYADYLPLLIIYSVFFFAVAASFAAAAFATIKRRGLIESSGPLIVGAAFMAIMFFDYKHAVVRNDIHLLSFTPFLFLGLIFATVCIALVFKKLQQLGRQYVKQILVVYGLLVLVAHVCVFMVLVPMPSLNLGIQSYVDQRIAMLNHTALDRLNFTYFSNNRELSKKGIELRSKDVEAIKEKMRDLPNKEIIFYGNTTLYGEAFSNDYKVIYPPFLQNYVAYPPQAADDLYIAFLQKHPDALVYADEREPSIDKRIPAHELNKFFQYLRNNYALVASDIASGQFVYQRVSSDTEVCKTIATFTLKDAERAPLPKLPDPPSRGYIKLVLNHSSNPLEKAVSALFKSPVYSLALITPEDAAMTVRTTKTTLEHGIAIKPFHHSVRDVSLGQPFVMKTFVLSNGMPISTSYQANVQMCSFGENAQE